MFYLGKIKHYLAWKTRKFYVQFVATWMNLVDIKLNKSVIESQSCVTPFAWERSYTSTCQQRGSGATVQGVKF